MHVARNVMMDPRLCPGGGATEMALSKVLDEKASHITGVMQWPYKAVARAVEVIPETLIMNCGANCIRTLTQLKAKHAEGNNSSWGIDGDTGKLTDMKEVGIWDCYAVKAQTYRTALESAMVLLRIDDIVSGTKKADGLEGTGHQEQAAPTEASQAEQPFQKLPKLWQIPDTAQEYSNICRFCSYMCS